MKRTFLIVLSLAIVLGVFVRVRTDGFTPEVCQPVAETSAGEQVFSSVPTRFTYLGRGRQAFAFVSEDGETVLKLFNRKRLEVPWYAKISGLFLKRKERSQFRLKIFPQSYRLAHAYIPEETGLLTVHLERSETVWPTVQLTDKASRQFSVNLNEVAFVLQKKGEGTLLEKLKSVRKNAPLLKSLINQYLGFHAKRISQFVADRDRDILWNYSWRGEALLYIDPAQFYYDEKLQEPARLNHEWWGCTYRLRRWLSKHSPETLAWYDARVNEEITALLHK
jgi:hypothetical protein